MFGDHDIHYRCLRDNQQYEDTMGEAEDLDISSAEWPLFGVVWPGGEVLAQLMGYYDIEGRRILEMGCGIGLASLVLNERMANISATDRHPRAADFLQHNTQLNNKRHIPFVRTAWEDSQDARLGVFDLLIGSDLLYDRSHSKNLALFIQNRAKPRSEVILVDAARGYINNFSFRMSELGFSHQPLIPAAPLLTSGKFKGKIHRYRRNL